MVSDGILSWHNWGQKMDLNLRFYHVVGIIIWPQSGLGFNKYLKVMKYLMPQKRNY